MSQSTRRVIDRFGIIATIMVSTVSSMRCRITLRIRCKGGRVQRHFENGADPAEDAVHDTGQEFRTYAVMVGFCEDQDRLREAILLVSEINMAGTAIGTGIASHPDYAALVCSHLKANNRDRASHGT